MQESGVAVAKNVGQSDHVKASKDAAGKLHFFVKENFRNTLHLFKL